MAGTDQASQTRSDKASQTRSVAFDSQSQACPLVVHGAGVERLYLACLGVQSVLCAGHELVHLLAAQVSAFFQHTNQVAEPARPARTHIPAEHRQKWPHSAHWTRKG